MSHCQEESKKQLTDLIIFKDSNRKAFTYFLKSFFHFIPTKTVHFLTFYNYINLPMFISEKTFIGLFLNSHSVNIDKMFSTLVTFYYGDLEERISLLLSILDFEMNGTIHIENVKNFLRRFIIVHSKENEELITLGNDIIDKFFGSNITISADIFKTILINENCDIFYLFYVFYTQNIFFNYQCYEYYAKNFYVMNDSISSREDQLLLHKNKEFLEQLPNPSETLLEFLNMKFNMNFVLDEGLQELESFENEIQETKSVIRQFSPIKMNGPSRKIKTDTNLMFFQKILQTFDSSTKATSKTNYSFKTVSHFIKPPNIQTFKAFWNKGTKFVQYSIDILENVIFISSKENELKLLLSTHQLFLEVVTDPEDDIIKQSQGKVPLVLCSTLTNSIKKCILYFDNQQTVDKVISIIEKTMKYKPFDNRRYINQNIMDHGSFGQIIKSYDNILNKEVAIKMIKKKYEDIETLKMIRNEQDISFFLKMTKYQGIVTIYDIYETKDTVYIIEEYIKNGNLKDYLVQNELSIEEREAIVSQIAHSISFLHTNFIVHRDLKMENILVDASSSPIQTKIIDFGLSKVFTINENMAEKYGTLLYLPPEIVLNNRYSYKIDIWLFGIITYTVLNKGVHPFANETEVEQLLQKIISRKFDFSIFNKKYQNILSLCLVREKDRADLKTILKLIEGKSK